MQSRERTRLLGASVENPVLERNGFDSAANVSAMVGYLESFASLLLRMNERAFRLSGRL